MLLMHRKNNPGWGEGEGKSLFRGMRDSALNTFCHVIGKKKRILLRRNNLVNYLACVSLSNAHKNPMR